MNNFKNNMFLFEISIGILSASKSSDLLSCNYKNYSFKSNLENIIQHTALFHSNDFNFQIKCCFENCNKRFGLNCSLRDKLKNENFPHNPTKLHLNFQENSQILARKRFLDK